ncbi:fibronectin type III domain-containing protein [Pelagicoccus sp. SDUM812003]|uniref:fibronectin type III domain-containing protein n=1 Tax=Pelagicoccus sp. SDUM812003 TaxID=3041267 RepID=UPI00280F39A6|nr:fibronectin type III domain-containing protein [Pelagicoccus sp. SDUM812003]MDQ8204135.1 fibronectin type III domain-containing protein [Pelagicoccus sp. SDUM812003]
MKHLRKSLLLLLLATPFALLAHESGDHWHPAKFAVELEHAPTPIPERVVLTWNDDPATTQAVTWRTDTSVKQAVAEIAIANANGRALKPDRFKATTEFFKSDINEAHYHSVTFRSLEPDTLYAYRVGDGENWSEYFHFRTASATAEPFTFIYFGDAQNEVKTHWSRVFREAFSEAPRAAFSLHAGDLINRDELDAEWGEWHGAPGWVNGTIPVIATPGNHEYFRANQGPANERFWNAKDGAALDLDVEIVETKSDDGKELYKVTARSADGRSAYLEVNDDDEIILVGEGVEELTGYLEEDLLGTEVDKQPLRDRLQNRGIPTVSTHWRPQFSFPLQGGPGGTEETCYYIDYQGTRFISLDSNRSREEQVPWLRKVLEDNTNRWTVLTFHHPIFSPASDRDNKELRELWKPVFDEFKVDLVLNGHDHTYARTGDIRDTADFANIPSGYQQAYDPEIGTVYVVSVSGPKMYDITKGDFAKRVAEDAQLYQVISIAGDELEYKAFTATGRLYDAFTLKKRAGRPNELIELLPAENRREE